MLVFCPGVKPRLSALPSYRVALPGSQQVAQNTYLALPQPLSSRQHQQRDYQPSQPNTTATRPGWSCNEDIDRADERYCGKLEGKPRPQQSLSPLQETTPSQAQFEDAGNLSPRPIDGECTLPSKASRQGNLQRDEIAIMVLCEPKERGTCLQVATHKVSAYSRRSNLA